MTERERHLSAQQRHHSAHAAYISMPQFGWPRYLLYPSLNTPHVVTDIKYSMLTPTWNIRSIYHDSVQKTSSGYIRGIKE